MIILSGLGNPGREYDGTRHNLGFEVIDSLHKNYGFPDFKKNLMVCLLNATFWEKKWQYLNLKVL